MARILDPNEAADDAGYTQIRDLVGITADNATIDRNPLFLAAENEIIMINSDVTDRAYANRGVVINALAFCAAANLLRGGGSITTSSTQGSGAVKSLQETIGIISKRTEYDVGSSQSSVGITSVSNRIAYFQRQCRDLLASIGIVIPVDDAFYSEVLVSC